MLMKEMTRLRRVSSLNLFRAINQIASRDRAPIFFFAGGHRFFLRGAESIFDILCRFLPPALQRRSVGQLVFLDKCFRALQTINREWFLANIVGDVTEIVVFSMTG